VPAQQTILLVEDNEVVREGLAALLWGNGYRVVTAADGEQALGRLRWGPRPDLILLDMLMPVLDGWHFLARLKAGGPRPPVPVVVTTSTILSREWAQDHGCQGFLKKPFEAEQLLDEVRLCLEGRAPSPADA
jgi:CheY-like chemotaxis protein